MKLLVQLLFLISASSILAAEYAVFGDAGQLRPELDALKTSIANEKVKAVVLLGDQIYDTSKSYGQVWDRFKNSGLEFKVVALGNHHKSYSEEMDYFGLSAEFYTKEFFDEVFIVLNSDNTKNVFTQMRFLVSELEKFENTKKHIFIIFHHPVETISEFHTWDERWLFQLCFSLVIHNYRNDVSAIFVGHDHFSGYYTFKKIPMVLAGGAVDLRNGRYDLSKNKSVTNEFIEDKKQAWLKLSTDSQKVVFEFIDVKTQNRIFTKTVLKK